MSHILTRELASACQQGTVMQGSILVPVLAVWFRYRGLSGILWLAAFPLMFGWRKRNGRRKVPAASLIQ